MQEQIYLRPLSLRDINEKYLFWVNDKSITEYLEIGKKQLTRDDLIKYVKESPNNGRFNYAIVTKNSKKHIGNGSIFSIQKEKGKFEIGYLIGEKKFWGGHYSSMAIFNLLKIGFIEMDLKKCIGFVNETHIKARMTNKFSGYREIKKYSRFWKKENKTINEISLEITKKNWLDNTNVLISKFPEFYQL